MKLWAILLLFIPQVISAQNLSSDEKEFNYPEFRECGLITRFAPSKIPPNCLTKALNVYYDDDFTTSRRSGFSVFNSTACGTGVITGMWNYDAVTGVRYIALQTGASFYYTTSQAGCTQITGLNAINTTNPLECTQALGKLWCVNGVDKAFSWDGSTVNYHYTLPLGTLINTFRNRLVVGNVSGDPARIYLSGDGDGDDWHVEIPGASTSPASISISGLNDGKVITGLLGQYQNAFEVGRNDDLYALAGNDRRDFTLRQISSQIGVKDKRTVREKDNCLIWLSNRGVEKQCGSSIDRISDGIKANIDEIILSVGNTRQKNYTSQAEWEAGVSSTGVLEVNLGFRRGPTSTTILPGSVVPSTWGATSSFNIGQLVGITSDTANNYTFLKYSSATVLVSTDGIAGSGVSWNLNSTLGTYDTLSTANSATAFEALLSYQDITDRYISIRSSPTNLAETGTFSFAFHNVGAWQSKFGTVFNRQPQLEYYFMSDSSDTAIMNGYGFKLWDTAVQGGGSSAVSYRAAITKMTSGHETILSTTSCSYTSSNRLYTDPTVGYANDVILDSSVTIKRANDGLITVSFSGLCGPMSAMTTDGANNYLVFKTTVSATSAGHYTAYANNTVSVSTVYYSSGGYVGSGGFSGVYTSTFMDTTFSTPTAGYFDGNDTNDSASTITYQIRQSSVSSGSPAGSWVTVGTNSIRVPFEYRYWQYRFQLDTTVSSITPIAYLPTMQATVTGYYIADCADTSGGTSVGTFRPITNLTGANVVQFKVSTGASCNAVTRATSTWTSQTANAPIALGTAPYTAFMAVLQPYASTDSTRLDAVTLEWYEGDRPPLGSAVYRDRYYLFYTTSTATGSANNNALVYDLNGKWTMLDDVYAYASLVHDTKLYTSDSRGGGVINQQDIGIDDGGKSFEFTIKTNDYDFGNPVEKKQLRRVYLMLKSEVTTGQNIDLVLKYYVNGSTTAYSFSPSSTVDLSEGPEQGLFVAKFPVPVNNELTFNWISFELSYSGNQGPLSLISIKTVIKPLRWE